MWDADKLDGFGPMGIARFLIIGDSLGWTIKEGVKNARDQITEVYNTDFAYTKTAQRLIEKRLKKSMRMCREILKEAIE